MNNVFESFTKFLQDCKMHHPNFVTDPSLVSDFQCITISDVNNGYFVP